MQTSSIICIFIILNSWLDQANIWAQIRCDLIPITFRSTLRVVENAVIQDTFQPKLDKIKNSTSNQNVFMIYEVT